MAEVIKPGESVTPAPGLLNKGGKDEEGLENASILWVLEPFSCPFFRVSLQ